MRHDSTPPNKIGRKKKSHRKTTASGLNPFTLPKDDEKENNKPSNVPQPATATNKPAPQAPGEIPPLQQPVLVAAGSVAESSEHNELRKRREEIEKLTTEKQHLEEKVSWFLKRINKRDQEISAEQAEKEQLRLKVASLTAAISRLEERIGELEEDLAKVREEKAIEEEKSRHLAKLHADQAHQHAAILAEEQQHHEKALKEERVKLQSLEVELEQSHQINSSLSRELDEAHNEMQEMKQSQEATQQLATLTAIKDAFALQIEVQKKENETLVSQLDHLQRELFFSIAVAVKLSLSLAGTPCNMDVQTLWEKALLDGIKAEQFSRWISLQITAPRNVASKQSDQ